MTRSATPLRISASLSLPLEAITETVAILGIRGSGKTNTCVVLSEELLAAGQQVVVIDPTDVWWGIKSSKDGAHPGYPVVVFGGRHGDVPLVAGDGATVADFVVDERLPAILSLRHFESQADQRRFVTEFARRLYHRKGEEGKDTPLLLAIDEAHLFVPQRVGAAEAQMVGAIQKLVRQGRSSGIGVAIIDQRAASVNKDILTQLELLICHRTTSPQDRKALEAWIEQHDTADQKGVFLKRLAELGRGVAWCWSPGWLDIFEEVAIRERRTFDSSSTPKPGEKRLTPTTLAHVDLEALRARMGAALEEVKASDPKELRKRILELEKQLEGKPVEREIVDRVVERPLVTEAEWKRIDESRGTLLSLRDEVDEQIDHIAGVLDIIKERVTFWRNVDRAELPVAGEPHLPPAFRRPTVPAASTPSSPRPAVRFTGDASTITAGGERKILTALAQYPAGRTKIQVALLTSYSHNGGGFNNYISALRGRGLLEGPSEKLKITAAGVAALGAFERLPTGAALLEHWKTKVGKAGRLVLEELARVHPSALKKEAIANRTGYEANGGGFNNALSELRTLELIQGRAEVRISDELVGARR